MYISSSLWWLDYNYAVDGYLIAWYSELITLVSWVLSCILLIFLFLDWTVSELWSIASFLWAL